MGDCLSRVSIKTIRTSLALPVRTTSSRRTTSQTAIPTRRGARHRAASATGGEHLAPITWRAGREQPVTTSQQPVNPSHELRNTHPPKLTRANPPGHSQGKCNHHMPAMLRYKAVALGS